MRCLNRWTSKGKILHSIGTERNDVTDTHIMTRPKGCQLLLNQRLKDSQDSMLFHDSAMKELYEVNVFQVHVAVCCARQDT